MGYIPFFMNDFTVMVFKIQHPENSRFTQTDYLFMYAKNQYRDLSPSSNIFLNFAQTTL